MRYYWVISVRKDLFRTVLYLRWKLKWWLHNLTLMFNLFTVLSLALSIDINERNVRNFECRSCHCPASPERARSPAGDRHVRYQTFIRLQDSPLWTKVSFITDKGLIWLPVIHKHSLQLGFRQKNKFKNFKIVIPCKPILSFLSL